jgi:hypothetical protein
MSKVKVESQPLGITNGTERRENASWMIRRSGDRLPSGEIALDTPLNLRCLLRFCRRPAKVGDRRTIAADRGRIERDSYRQ